MTVSVRWAAGAFLATAGTLYLALTLGHADPGSVPEGIPDPGVFTGWLLPAVKVLDDVAGLATAGFLLAAAFLLPSSSPEVRGLAADSVRMARRAALVWAVGTVAYFFLQASSLFGTPIPALSGAVLYQLAFSSQIGWAIIAQGVIALAVAVLARRTFSIRLLALLLGLALAGFVPQALSGHSAGSGSHDLAVVSMMFHLAAAALWVGGLGALAWIAVRGSRRLGAAVRRFSVLAAWCVALLAVSGVLNAATRLDGWSSLLSRYGLLVGAKVAALVALGVLGWLHRRRTLPAFDAADGAGRAADDPSGETSVLRRRANRAFLRLAAAELVVMGMTVAVAVALSQTETPRPADLYTGTAEELLDGPMPAAPTLARLVLGVELSGTGLAIVGMGCALYVTGLLVMRRRGDRWPLGRTLAWFSGMALVAWATFGGLGVYSHAMFSAHMVSHMILSMVAPILLMLGAPITLALRTLPGPRQPGDVAPRAMLVSFLHSRFVRVVTHPLVAAFLFVGSLYALYFTSLFETAMYSHIGHGLMEVHFLLVGSLFYYVIIGVDPSPRRIEPIWRFLILLVTLPFHAFFSVALMAQQEVVAEQFYVDLNRPFATDLLADQYLGGGIAWAMGEVPLVIVMAALFVQWIRQDRREAVRHDRRAAQNDDAELEAYNAYLARLAEQSGPGSSEPGPGSS
ncbi:putative copper resistance protein D [Mumia flava]|uniref:Putative copper resistance protein D n=1 Tax=Mumia flava TaxID=1348852 RepID=A0A0B2B468_9ACTN|nr:cytochrome c oxidase assembly protein [Mumia flava]PJJ53401.1 putative copper resistance protein D [Mumia flava]